MMEAAPAIPAVAEEDDLEIERSLYLAAFSFSKAAIYETKIRIRDVGGGRVAVFPEAAIAKGQLIDPLTTSTDCWAEKPILSAAFGSLYSDMYLFAGDIDDSITTCTFNMETKKISSDLVSCAPKWYPTVITVDEKLYVLSNGSLSINDQIALPAFESFNLVTGSWHSLTQAPFHFPSNPLRHERVLGYAVFGSYIIVSLVTLIDLGKFELSFLSYNTLSDKWKPVSTSEDVEYHGFRGKAEVIDSAIYVYLGYDKLVAYPSLTQLLAAPNSESVSDLWLCPPIILQVDNFTHPPDEWWGETSECISGIGNRMFCLVQTGRNFQLCHFQRDQYACISVIQIHGRLCIKTLNSWTCKLNIEGFPWAWVDISPCFGLKPEEFASTAREKLATRKIDAMDASAVEGTDGMASN